MKQYRHFIGILAVALLASGCRPVGGLSPAQAPPRTALTNAAATAGTEADWRYAARLTGRIQPPRFPGREYPITAFGAVADGSRDSSAAIARAITACARAGGGRVVVPPGQYLTGPIHLRSGVNLHLERDATLCFKTDPQAYLPAVFTRFEGMECWNFSPLIYACDQENVAVTGEGVLDGQASEENWWAWKGSRSGTNNQNAARARLVRMVAEHVPPDQRRFGAGDFLRPNFIQFYRCRNVLVEGVRIRHSPMWEIHPVLCTNVVVRNVDILSHGTNNDGCNPESSRDVLIEGCVFDTGDDCIAIKSGRNDDGRRLAMPAQDILIRRCVMRDGHGGVTIGSEISGGCRRVFVEDCQMDSPNLDRVLRFKSNAVRGGVVEDIFARRLRVGQVRDAVLQIDFQYEEGANGPHRPVVRRVVAEDITVANAPRVLDIRGLPNGEITGVRLSNCTFGGITKPDLVQHAAVELVDCRVDKAR